VLPVAHAWRILGLAVIALAGCSLLVDQNLADKPREDGGGGGGGGTAGAGAGSTTSASGSGMGGIPIGCDGSCDPAACCGGGCVDLNTNADHCGTCDKACLAGRVCSGGKCVPAWAAMSSAFSFAPRVDAAATWTGSSMFVWGGFDDAKDRADGALYYPEKDTWEAISNGFAPSARALAAAVWTGSRVIVFGGGPSGSQDAFGDGAQYDPASDTWSALKSPGPPSAARRLPMAFWSGSLAVFWGGEAKGAPLASGLRYDPAGDTWTPVTKTGAPSARRGAAWAWTGSKLLIFGGTIDGVGATSEGFLYDPKLDQWSAMSPTNAPSARYDAFAVWMGDASGMGELLVWGGRGAGDKEVDTGARYNPATDQWQAISTQGSPSKRSAPMGRSGFTAWTGLRALVVGGADGQNFKTDGGSFEPANDAWSAPVPSWPNGKSHERGVGLWTGRELIVWGGRDGGSLVEGGERYLP
jgi:N-acetylneuraminic acid mutarotase